MDFAAAPTKASHRTTAFHGLVPQGAGTWQVESLHSYILALAHSHFLSANVFVREGLALASAADGLDALPTWGWDKGAGSTLMGVSDLAGSLSRRFAALTGREEVLLTTLAGLNGHTCGQELIHPRERVCTKCLQEDLDRGQLPYSRLLWRVSAVTACPLHRVRLKEAACGNQAGHSRASLFGRRRLSGSCGYCGSLGFRCICAPELPATENEVWVAQQVGTVIQALPKLQQTNPLVMKDAVRAYCGRTNGSVKLSERIGVPKSQVSRWLRRPEHRFSLPCLLDMCASEGFELARLLMGDLARTAWPSEVRPERQRRQFKYHDHRVIEEALQHAIDTGESISSVADQLGIDVSTLARHEELYARLRDRNQALNQQQHADSQRAAVAEAEQVVLALSRQGQTPTLRNASDTTGSRWYPSQLRAIALHALRMRMGATNLRPLTKMFNVGPDFLRLVDDAAARLLDLVDRKQLALFA